MISCPGCNPDADPLPKKIMQVEGKTETGTPKAMILIALASSEGGEVIVDSQMDALSFSLINIIIVFFVLILLQGVIQLIKFVFYKKPSDPVEIAPPINKTDNEVEKSATATSDKEGDVPAKIAAACAAVAANLDGIPHRIVSIRRLTPQSLWIQSARMENMRNNAMLRHRR
ncbi:OadG family protein [Thermoactinomyces mirandus]|uniref:OadG family protein n=1 Tax=Thermoactinomyces mirandus TaxID=2756294 RepID=A0A7W2AS81_9BACL|nr:OadG family protein [Thermoactinomyces mirandus]MBA4603323.1 OadG family protein [Thermoactinomyces mirandus]